MSPPAGGVSIAATQVSARLLSPLRICSTGRFVPPAALPLARPPTMRRVARTGISERNRVGEHMQAVYLFRVERVEGTQAHNVARTVKYAARQLGLRVQSYESDALWSTFYARIGGDPGEIARLAGLLELAFPNAAVTVETASLDDEKAPGD